MGLVLLVRHGQASFGADDYDVLSQTGWEQGRALGRWLAVRGEGPVRVVRGGLRRHRETWEALREGVVGAGGGVDADAEVDDRWNEIDVTAVFAAAQAERPLDRAVFQQHYERSMLRWTEGTDEAGLFPETWAGFGGRVLDALDAVVAPGDAAGPTVVVTSGGPVALCAAALLADADRGRDPLAVGPSYRRLVTTVVNSSVTRVVVGRSGTRLLTYNEHAHLDRGLVTYR